MARRGGFRGLAVAGCVGMTSMGIGPARAEQDARLPVPDVLAGAEALPMPGPERGVSREEESSVYRFDAGEPGVLTVAVRSRGDVALAVADAYGQSVWDGYGDWDLAGDPGAEQLAVTLGQPGRYHVEVQTYDPHAVFVITAAFLPLPEAARPGDPHGDPSSAVALEPGQRRGETLRPLRGDVRDWYRIEPTEPMRVTARLQGTADVVLEAFAPDDFLAPTHYADDDLDGDLGREAVGLELDPEAGPVYLRVSGYDEGADYTLELEPAP